MTRPHQAPFFKANNIMNTIFSHITKRVISLVLILVIVMCPTMISPRQAHAQWAVTVIGDVSPTGIMNSINHEMQQLKSFVYDHLANLIVKQLLHQMTASVINWINSGFQGNPSFISDPQGFFLDVGDQISGAFLSQDTGPLKNLCGSLGTNISLTLALGQTFNNNARYTCTFGSIFNNVKNIPNNTYINGRSLTSFMNGDFSQGGWKGFIQLTQNPQNNGTGAYLQGHSDLLSAIGIKHSSINQSLLQGSGFLSFESCKDVPLTQTTAPSPVSNSSYNSLPGSNDAFNSAIDPTGLTQAIPTQQSTNITQAPATTKKCTTETPGSVISSKLMKNLNSPETQLELANDINAIIDALVNQMITQLLTGGLGSLSGGGSGGSSALTNQIIDEDLRAQEDPESLGIAGTSLGDASSNYDQAISALTDTEQRLMSAKTCFTTKQNLTTSQISYVNQQVSSIDSMIDNQVTPYIGGLQTKKSTVLAQIRQLNGLDSTVNSQSTLTGLRTTIPSVRSGVGTNTTAENTYVATSKADLSSAQTQATTLNTSAAQFQWNCENINLTTGYYR